MEEIKVSVIVPVYNAERYLQQCLDSICNQTLKEIEIILVDDESKDGSLAILESYAKKDKRITIINNTHVGEGAASARNAGLSVAKGKYLSFLDSDDYFELDLLQKVYGQAEKTDADVVVYDGKLYDHAVEGVVDTSIILDTYRLPMQEVFSAKDIPDDIFLFSVAAPWSKLFRRALIMEKEIRFQPVYYTDDIAFVFGALGVAESIAVVPEKLLYYRINHGNSQVEQKETAPLSSIYACVELKRFLQQHHRFDIVKNGFANYAIDTFAFCLSAYKNIDSFKTMYDALATKYIEELDLEQSMTKNVLKFDVMEWLKRVKQNDPLAYGFLNDGYLRNDLFFRYGSKKLFPIGIIRKDTRVILYGAGKVGTGLYIQNVLENHCQIVAWVDKSPKNKPFPVEGLDALKREKNNVDYILISIENRATAEKVKQFLLRDGWKEEHILLYDMEYK